MNRAIVSVSVLVGMLASWPGLAWAEGEWTWSAGPRIEVGYNSFNIEPDLNPAMSSPALTSASGGSSEQLPVPDLTGIGGGAGVAVELYYGGWVGGEVGARLVQGRATGDKSVTMGPQSTSVDYDLTTVELQLPVLLKLQRRTSLATLQVGVGLTAVFQLASELATDPDLVTVETGRQTDLMPTVMLGVRLPYGSLEIPIELRLMSVYEPESAEERFAREGTTLDVDTSWTGQAWLSMGLCWQGGL